MVVDASFWRGRRVLLTGHTGFKGSWLSLWLQHMGARVTGYALPAPTNPSLFELAQVAEGMQSIIGDIRDAQALQAAFRRAEPEIVIHMAAQPLVRYSYAEPVETYSTNVMGTVNVLEGVRNSPDVKSVVVVTTDKCYENREWAWGYRENEPMGGHDPYSSSKGCAELVTSAYRSSFFGDRPGAHPARIASARAGNVIGGGDWADDRLVPDIVRALMADKPILVRNPNSTRPWQHVLEPLGGYLLLAQRLATDGEAFAGGWNFGPRDDDAQPVLEVVKRFCKHWGGASSWELSSTQGPHEAHYLKLDCSKASAYLGWQPQWNLDEAIARIVDWNRTHQKGGDLRATTLAQISDYPQT
ncbi:MAG: CDP-glucose 4,6-dehydratase [Ramlibacter sp.]|jgi:CDP-glucose 4,6-dehydratase|nr:CDP-glucose 4,6-dehydratase [Ramlibacter sp.]MDB5912130.1 CDP-glucose 4,6-dehydratase [Ramlibacter sp.]